MTGLLVKLFVKDYRNTADPKVRRGYGVLASVVGILCNAVLCAAKIACGLLFSSIAILADGLNNLSDAGSSVVSLFGFKLAGRPADEEHPFGHARIEYIAGLIIAFIILFLGLQLVMSSAEKIASPSPINTSYLAVGVLCASVAVKLWMSLFNRNLGKRIGSVALAATATDSLNDVFATTAVLIATLVAMFTGVQLDGWMGIAVALFIMFSGVKIMRETLSPLLGEVPGREMVQAMCDRIRAYPGVMGLHDLVVHNYGPENFYVSVHVEVDAKVDIMISHEMIDTIERDFLSEGVHLVIHLDPVVTGDAASDALKALAAEAVRSVDERLTVHDFRAVIGANRKNLIFDVVVPPHYKKSDNDLKNAIQIAVQEKDPTCFTVINLDRNYVGPYQ